MQHIDDDLLALIALQVEQPDAQSDAHLQTCDRCRSELESLQRVVTAGRAAPREAELVEPPDRVWAGITAALATAEQVGQEPRVDALRQPAGGGSAAAPAVALPPEVTSLESRRSRRAPTWLMVAAGFVVGAVGAGAVVAAVTNDDDGGQGSSVVATAKLDPLDQTGTAGSAEVLDVSGHRVLDVRIDSRTTGAGYREVWLLDADAGRLVSLGVLTGTESRLVIPDGLDLAEYPVVDVSREPLDGNPAHSSDSIARGTLEL